MGTAKRFTISQYGLMRLGVASPELKVADVEGNLAEILRIADQAQEAGCRMLVTPELSLTGYTCADLFYQQHLLDSVELALKKLAAFTSGHDLALVVGAPLRQRGRLFNCAVFLSGGTIRGVVPKSCLPGSAEFYEERWFSAAADAVDTEIRICDTAIPFGNDLLFVAKDTEDCVVGIEICEDAWVTEPPSGQMALAGATILLNLSASPETLAKIGYRRTLVEAQSARCLSVYAYASAGVGESSTDLVFSGHSLIAEYGVILAETERFKLDSQLALADVDLRRMQQERRRLNSFSAVVPHRTFRRIEFRLEDTVVTRLMRPLSPWPFVPQDPQKRDHHCEEIFQLQTAGLVKRLRHTGLRQLVVGVSGGLDSTLALLVAVKAFDTLELSRKGILAVTMPGFGTTSRTRSNAEQLAMQLGVSFQEIRIDTAVRQHFADIGHDESQQDITYENCQARERTQILMDLANGCNGLVLGTGDMSEMALGWSTYNGDHMSMYAVNCGVPKTLVRYLVDWVADRQFDAETAKVLHDIVATPVSPELLPPSAEGDIVQQTEAEIGPYELHDFFLYQMVRVHFGPAKIFFLAQLAFVDRYTPEEILTWLRLFYRRFFSQQFKRSCTPDGPKVGSVALSPRGDWRMPSDACVDLWLKELDVLQADLR